MGWRTATARLLPSRPESTTAELARLAALLTLVGLLVLVGLVTLGGDPTEAIHALPFMLGGGMAGGGALAAAYGLRHWGGTGRPSPTANPQYPPVRQGEP